MSREQGTRFVALVDKKAEDVEWGAQKMRLAGDRDVYQLLVPNDVKAGDLVIFEVTSHPKWDMSSPRGWVLKVAEGTDEVKERG